MTTHAEELLGAQVTAADGKVIGTIEHVFEDDASGAPAWASVRAGKTNRFVPVGAGRATADGLNIPFDAETIMTSPTIEAGKHMSGAQAEELLRYYDPRVRAEPQQRGKSEDSQRAKAEERQQRAKAEESQQRAKAEESQQRARAEESQQRAKAEERQQRAKAEESQQRAKAEERKRSKADEEWLLRREQQLQVGKETRESGHVRLHRYVDSEPAEKTVHLVHEEYDVERVPVGADEPVGDDLREDEQKVTLHAERGIVSKQTVPVERLRLVTKSVEEDETFREELQRERIEVEPEEELEHAHGGNRSRR
jgi:uncharacterized protein (TIGR02271 family)